MIRHKLPDNDPRAQPWIPVVSSTGKPLMPCKPKRARELIGKDRAIKRWSKGIFYIQLIDREDGDTQSLSIGIDPGSIREGYCLMSRLRVFLNIQSHAVDGKAIKRKMEVRSSLRRGRRHRKTPCRPPRWFNRTRVGWIPPSTKARWQLKLNIVKWLMKLYPISHCAIEDVSAVTKKGSKKWNTSFSPIQVGKNWLYSKLRILFPGSFKNLPGYYSFEERTVAGLRKSSNKLSTDWHAHCVDAYILASSWFIPCHHRVVQKKVMELIPRKWYRRQLHRLVYRKGHTRPVYGGTMSSGYKKGTVVTHPKWGVCTLGPTSRIGISLYSRDVKQSRLTRSAKLDDLKIHMYAPWLLVAIS